MAYTPKNWTNNSYTVATWFKLVNEKAVLSTILIANTAASAVSLEMKLTESNTDKAQLVAKQPLQAGETFTLDLRSLNLTNNQALEVKGYATGLEFIASGVTY